ncbi:hypothetical protein N7493_000433 [Penicillium malachiteum]|uniref:Uncharacterized protein n=1 Tax=Penicillium malachiteum TaxID=1324776 RepID=A0AAD6N0V3_9EURO|nr:hypothetical protein N7493_000433 [Penicillium malachiteum]
MRYAERLEKGPDSDSETDSLGQSNTLCTVSSKRVDPITVLAASPLGRFYCCGTEHEFVRLFDIQDSKVSDIHDSNSFLSIEHIVWSHNAQFICFSDSSKNIFAASISTSNSMTVEIVAKIFMKSSTAGPITQLLFHPDSSRIHLSTLTTVFVLSIPSGSVTHSLELSFDVCKWGFHPHDQTIVLGFEPSSIIKCDWTLNKINTFRFQFPDNVPESSQIDLNRDKMVVIDRILFTSDKNRILSQISTGMGLKEKVILCFPTSCLSGPLHSRQDSEVEEAKTIIRTFLPKPLASLLYLSIWILGQDRLIFLSKNFSIASCKIPSGQEENSHFPSHRRQTIASISSVGTSLNGNGNTDDASVLLQYGVKEILPLPGDWISPDSLALCCVWTEERSFLCPRNGEVAVVKSVGLA